MDLEAGTGLEGLRDVEAPSWMVPGVARLVNRLDPVHHHADAAADDVAERVVIRVHVAGLQVALLEVEVHDHRAGRDGGQDQRPAAEIDLAVRDAPAGEG